MKYRFIRSLRRVPLFVATLLVSVSSGWALPDSTQAAPPPREVVLFVGGLNLDCVPDTVVGVLDHSYQFCPTGIRWGARDSVGFCASDTAGGLAAIPASQRVAVTWLMHPGWLRASGAAALQDMNADSASDLVLFLWGRVGKGEHEHDTSRSLVIFAQRGLDTLASIDLANIAPELQMTPFFAMEMLVGSQIVEPGVRDYTGQVSYRLLPIGVSDPTLSVDEPMLPGKTDEPWFNVYPNPAVYTTTIEARRVKPGQYRVVLYELSGQIHTQQDLTIDSDGSLFRTLNLESVPTGCYLLRLQSAQQPLIDFPIVVLH